MLQLAASFEVLRRGGAVCCGVMSASGVALGAAGS